MHSVADMGGTNVPAFLTKIWTLVDDPSTDELIAWDATGSSFHMYDQARFAKEILPRYFKHNNIASFIRQLNMYGFRKVVHVGEGAMKSESDDVEFKHPYFMIGQEHLLEYIKRKPSSTPATMKDPGAIRMSQDDVQKVLGDVNDLKGKQDTFTSKMDNMKKQNEALWRELANLRQKHIKQQQIVNKLIQFMVHLVGGKRGLAQAAGLKRKMPLMINDASQVAKQKRPSYNKQLSIEEIPTEYVVDSPPGVRDSSSATGPIIHDVTDMYSPLAASGVSSISPSSFSTPPQGHNVTTSLLPNNLTMSDTGEIPSTLPSLDSTDLNSLVGANLLMPDELLQTSNMSDGLLDRFMKDHLIGPTSTITLPGPAVSGQLDHMQDELDGLHDLLSGGQYNFDVGMLTNIFSSEQGSVSTSVPRSVDNLLGSLEDKEKESTSATVSEPGIITGNELVSFQYMSPESLMNTGLMSPVPDLQDLITSDDIAGSLLMEDDTDNLDPLSFLTSLAMPHDNSDLKADHLTDHLD